MRFPARRSFRAREIIRYLVLAFSLYLTSCETIKHHFIDVSPNWEARVGQLRYHGPRTTIIGEVLVRFSQKGDFELTFSKGPGVTLLIIRQDASFARVEGPLAHGRWSGPIDRTPRRLLGWVSLRDALMKAKKQSALRQTVGRETFLFEF